MKAKWKVVTGNNGSTQVLIEGVSKKTAKLYAKGFNDRCKAEGWAKRARLEKVAHEEDGLWLVVGHNIRLNEDIPYEVLSIETSYDAARNIAMGVNTMTRETGDCADVVDLNQFPKVDPRGVDELKGRLLALGRQMYDMADQIKPRKLKANLPEANAEVDNLPPLEEPDLPDTLPKPKEELPKLYVEVTGLSDEPRYTSITDPRATYMATLESLNPGCKCRAIDTPEQVNQPHVGASA